MKLHLQRGSDSKGMCIMYPFLISHASEINLPKAPGAEQEQYISLLHLL